MGQPNLVNLKIERLNFLKSVYGRDSDKFDLEVAIAVETQLDLIHKQTERRK